MLVVNKTFHTSIKTGTGQQTVQQHTNNKVHIKKKIWPKFCCILKSETDCTIFRVTFI